jgi:hypothetical protein
LLGLPEDLSDWKVDAASARVLWPPKLGDDPVLLQGANQVLAWEPRGGHTAVPKEPLPGRDPDRAISAAAAFLQCRPQELAVETIEWTHPPGKPPEARLEVGSPAQPGRPATEVELTVRAADGWYVSSAQAEQAPGFASGVGPLALSDALARDSVGAWLGPRLPVPIIDHLTLIQDLREAGVVWWCHGTRDYLRTGSWAVCEVRPATLDGVRGYYISRYEARLAPEHAIDEMTVDLPEAVQTLRKEVESKPGATFLLDYAVPTLSHPSARNENPAWEIRYFVGPGGPEPIIRWAAVDATDGSLIYIDHDHPDTCFESRA